MMTFIENTKAFFVLLIHIFTLWPYEIIKALFFPRRRKDVNGEIMFMTGAGSGLGRLMSYRFAERGVIMICTDINKETADETVKTIKENGGNAYSFKLDVTDRHEVYKLANHIREEIGEVTMLVNNAGIVTGRSFMDCPDELMIKTMEVNTISHFWTLKAFLGPMMKKNHGHIVSIASIAGYGGSPKLVDYSASKFGAVGLSESLAIELMYDAPGVKSTVVCPWFIKTGMFAGAVSSSPILMPLMEPEWVVDQIVAGVLNDEAVLFIPKTLACIVIFKSLAPINLGMKVSDYLKLNEQMKNFTGRKKE